MVGCHHQLNGHEFEQILGVGGGQGRPECCGHGVINNNNKCSKQTRATRGKGDKPLIKTDGAPTPAPHPSTQKAAFWESLLL